MNNIGGKKAAPAACLLAAVLALAGCGEADAPPEQFSTDPAVIYALNDQILVDPDLANQNEANAVMTIGIDHSLPVLSPGRDSIRQARVEAVDMVGGEDRMKLPEPSPEPYNERAIASGVLDRAGDYQTLAEHAALLPGASDCLDELNYSAIWAARLPGAFPVYPRGATQSAAGNDRGDCTLRAVSFRSAAAMDDLVAFYAARARLNGFTVNYSKHAGGAVLSGERGRGEYLITLRETAGGSARVDFVSHSI